MASNETILITISGPDHPGITSALMAQLDAADATIGDVEQVVVRGHLVLSTVASLDDSSDVRKNMLLFCYEHGLNVDFEPVDPTPTERQLGVILTVLDDSISPRNLGAVATTLAGCGANIDRIVRLARYPVVAYQLECSGAPIEQLRAELVNVSLSEEIDIAIQQQGLGHRAQRLVVLDVDSTLIQDEIIDLLAAEAGCAEQVAAITDAAMNGEMDFTEALLARVALLEGLDEAALVRARQNVRFTPGARTFVRTLRRLGFRVALVSGGFTFFTDHLRSELKVDHAFANVLEQRDGRLTGRVTGRIIDRAHKAAVLRQVAELEGITLDQTVAVGDGANDLDMLAAAGLGIAFNAKAAVRDAADTTVNVPYLDAILFVLGVRRTEVEAADEADGTPTPAPPIPGADNPTSSA